ncbi:MAG TPA: amidohydrolase [Sedimentisphaerales bacterium]|nr:amidohydrolase [Sedimentisphaerales bacterium]
MSHNHKHRLTRRDFLKLSAAALGGASLACQAGPKMVELTAVPTPVSPTAQPIPTLAPGEVADTILVNGNIVTIDAQRTTAKALAIKDGIIRLVGDDQAARNLAGESSLVIDLMGRTVTPGLIDAHCHLSACGLLGTAYVDVSWPAVFTISEMQAKLAEKIADTPNGEWVVGAGWVTFEGRYPNKHDLDPISPNHPVFVVNQGGHMAAVNSLALELAGVNASTPDPGNGRFLREANGEPSGTVMNHPAMDYFRRLWPPDLLDVKVMETSILNPQATFAAMGVTSFQDVYARDMDRMQAYFDIARRGELSIRGQVMNVLEYIQELDGRIDAIEAMRYEDDFMRFAGAKFQVDGALEASFTNEPHDGIAWNIPIWKPKDLNEAVRAFHDAGYQVALHTAGDAAVDMALDAIENAMNKNPRPDPRHRIEHSVLNSDEALQRTKDLGVVISTQPTLIRAFADAVERIWGEERMQRIIPTRTWLDMGVPLCLSSDAPSMPWWDPQSTLFSAIVRASASKKPVSPEQALTIEEAMYAHTMAGAYADFAENEKGSLEPGKFADLIVWHDNPYTVATEDILKLTVDLTMVGGKVLHQV